MILEKWNQFSKTSIGKALFNRLFRIYVPYTGSIYPEVQELRPGYSRVKVADRKKIRNHLNSIHAAALMNLAEASSGLAFVCGLPKDARAIVTQFQVEYKKKARGNLIAECNCEVPKTAEEGAYTVEAQIKDEQGDIVAIGRATWLVRPAS